MRISDCRILLVVPALLTAGPLCAQNSEQPAYLNPSLPAQQRAADLVHRMTLEEKVTQLTNQARAIPRLNVPAYDWWSEALHGVAVNGTTEFPEPVGLAATFDTDGDSRDGGSHQHRRTHQACADVRWQGTADIFGGLDFWAPNHQHLPRSAVGTRAGDVRRRSVFDGADGRGVCDRDAGRRSEILSGDFDAEAFCRALGTGADAALGRCECEQARRTGHVSAGVSRGGDGSQGGQRDVRVQQHQRTAGVRERVSACRISCAASGDFQGYVVSDCGAVHNILDGHHFSRRSRRPRRSACSAGWTTSASTLRRRSRTTTITSHISMRESRVPEGERDRHGA